MPPATTRRPPTSRRDEVLATAAELFVERGYHGTSIRDIADAAGVRPASLYSHFASKEQILVELVDRYLDALLPRLAEAAAEPGDGATRLTGLIEVTTEVSAAHRREFLILSDDWKHIVRTPELGALVRRRDQATATWRAVIADGVADGSLRPDLDTAAALLVIFATLTGVFDERYASIAGRRGKRVPRPDGSRVPFVTILLDGLRAPPEAPRRRRR